MLALKLGQNIGGIANRNSFSNVYSLNFAGVDDYVNLNSAVGVIGTIRATLSAWAKLEDVGTDNTSIFKYYVDGSNQVTIIYLSSTNQFKFMYKAGGTVTQVLVSAGSIEGDGNFHHYAITYDVGAAELKAYIDGSQVGTTQTSFGTWSGTISVFELGRNSLAGTGYWIGQIDEIALFNAAKSSSDISSIYNGGKPNDLVGYSNLVGYWRNEEGSGTTIADASTNSNSGTLVNGTAFSRLVP